MNNTFRTTLIVVAVLVLAVGIFFAGVMFNRATTFGLNPMNSGSMMGGYNGNGPGGMMTGNTSSNAAQLTIDQMKTAAETYIQNSGLTGLEVGEIMVFHDNAYAIVMEKSTGMGAFELLADSGTQVAYPEYGPNMMWNLKYGGMAHNRMTAGRSDWMMGGWNNGKATPANVSAEMPVTREQAIVTAQTYLDQFIPGAKAADDPMQFYGYYTMDYEQNGMVAGMLSVNGYNGQIFLHTWHGTFIEESGMKMK